MTTTFGRVTRVAVGKEVRINMDDLNVEFEVVFDDDTEPNESTINVYNLSNATIAKIKRNERVELTAGYKTDGAGVILSSRVSSVQNPRDGVDRITRIKVIDGPDLDGIQLPERAETTGKGKKKTVKMTRKKTYGKNVKASQIIRDLVPLLGVAIGKIKLPKDVTYAKGYTVNGKVVDELKKLAEACKASFFIHKQRLYICTLADAASSTRFTLSSETGLIGSPEPYENDNERGFKVRCLLQYRISTASLITINSRTARGQFRVRRGRHVKSGSEFMTEIEVVKA